MAIAVEVSFNGNGATLENYFKSLTILGATPGGPHPDPGCLFHWVTDTPGGFRVIDVWQTRGQWDAFVPKVVAAAEQLDMPKPQTKFIDVANFLT